MSYEKVFPQMREGAKKISPRNDVYIFLLAP
jgi:hypothetical protein